MGASDICVTPTAPVCDINPHTPTSHNSDASGRVHISSASANLNLPTLSARDFQIMPTFQDNLLGIRKLCDRGYKVLFYKEAITVFSKYKQSILLKGWQDPTVAKIWHFHLCPEDHPDTRPPHFLPSDNTTPTALNAHDLSSVGALVRYLHAVTGFSVKSTWLAFIKSGNYSTWSSLTYPNASKYFPSSNETIKVHITQSQQGVRSTKPTRNNQPKPPPETINTPLLSDSAKELHFWLNPTSTLYTNNTSRFPIRSRSVNQYLMITYHCGTNVILIEPFQSREDRHRIPHTPAS